MEKCPACGSEVRYMGLFTIECSNRGCKFYVEPQLGPVTPVKSSEDDGHPAYTSDICAQIIKAYTVRALQSRVSRWPWPPYFPRNIIEVQ